jgi:hypothetical protein
MREALEGGANASVGVRTAGDGARMPGGRGAHAQGGGRIRLGRSAHG